MCTTRKGSDTPSSAAHLCKWWLVVFGPKLIWYWAERPGSNKGSPGCAQGWIITVSPVMADWPPLAPNWKQRKCSGKILRSSLGWKGKANGDRRSLWCVLQGRQEIGNYSVVKHHFLWLLLNPKYSTGCMGTTVSHPRQHSYLSGWFSSLPVRQDGAGFSPLSLDVCPICGLASSEP